MKLTVWGCRGSFPAPGRSTVRYGGNSTCFEVRNDAGELLIFDAGSGIRELGRALLPNMPLDGHLLISHTHWDHIMGYPFFAPLHVPGNRLQIMGPPHFDHSFREVMGGPMEYSYFPVRMEQLRADVTYEDMNTGHYDLGQYRVKTRPTNHPVFCLAFRVEADGQVLVYGGDHEPYDDHVWRDREPSDHRERAERDRFLSFVEEQNTAVIDFMRDADLVILDGTYTAVEYPARKGWGHSTMDWCIEASIQAHVRRLLITHHEPTRTDDELDELLAGFRADLRRRGERLEVGFATESETINLSAGQAGLAESA